MRSIRPSRRRAIPHWQYRRKSISPPHHVGYVIGSNISIGDWMFNPDLGSARCDFSCGAAVGLFHSTQKPVAFPGNYRLYTGHDHPPKDRQSCEGELLSVVPFTTVMHKDGAGVMAAKAWAFKRNTTTFQVTITSLC